MYNDIKTAIFDDEYEAKDFIEDMEKDGYKCKLVREAARGFVVYRVKYWKEGV